MARTVVTWVWACFGLGPFACLGLLLCLLGAAGSTAQARGDGYGMPWWVGALGACCVLLTPACAWQWTRPPSPSPRVELGRALLLALPGSYLPTLLALPAGELLRGRLAPAHVPTALSVWATVYAVWVGTILWSRTPLAEAAA